MSPHPMRSVRRLLAIASGSGGKKHYPPVSDDDAMTLNFLVHDKDHIGAHSQRIPALDMACRKLATRARVPLYRGLSREDVAQMDAPRPVFTRYWSFTELPKIARAFAKGYGTNTVVELTGARGFSLWEWSTEDTYDWPEDDDPETVREMLREEREWLLPIGYRVLVTGREQRSGLTYIQCTGGAK